MMDMLECHECLGMADVISRQQQPLSKNTVLGVGRGHHLLLEQFLAVTSNSSLTTHCWRMQHKAGHREGSRKGGHNKQQ